jgi:hypothetical protein
MTDSEWLAATDPEPMLAALRAAGKASDRKLRLFACACCRRVWHLLADPLARNAVEVAERLADGLAGDDERSAARRAAQQAVQPCHLVPRATAPRWRRRAASVVYWALARESGAAGNVASQLCLQALLARARGDDEPPAVARAERSLQAHELRDLFGNPFRPAPVLDAAWLSWGGGTAARLAQAAYDERQLPSGDLDPARLAVLADALEEAGCADAELLGHLRGPGPHMRGCFAVDLLLSRQ